MILVEGSSGDLIPQMKKRFGITTFDFIFLDHWKDRYLPDIKLFEVEDIFMFTPGSARSSRHSTFYPERESDCNQT